MALPDDINPDPADIPETSEFLEATGGNTFTPETDVPSVESEGVQPSNSVEDHSFESLSEVTKAEFELNNPEPVVDPVIASIPDVAVPEPPIESDDAPRTGPLRDSLKTYQQRLDDFNSMKATTKAEFKAKQGEPTATATPPPDSREELGEGIETWRSIKSDSTYEGAKDNSDPVQEFVDADQANRTEIGELLGAHARWIDQHTRFLESQRL